MDDWSEEEHAAQDRFHEEIMDILLDEFEKTGEIDWNAAFYEAARREKNGYKKE